MKRYISSFVLTLIVIGSIGTYYGTQAASLANLPGYEFKTIEGNEKELKPVILRGFANKDSISEPIIFEGNQLTYEREKSLVEQFSGEDEVEKRLKKYKSFIRGKHDLDSFYEDEDFLAYASLTNKYRNNKNVTTFEISLLEKETKKESSFELDVSEQGEKEYLRILDVQMIDSKLQVVVNNQVESQDSNEEIHVYTLDLANKKVINDKVILSELTSNAMDNVVQIHYPTASNTIGESHVFLYSLVKGTYSESDEFVPKETTLYKYDFETGKEETITLPKKDLIPDEEIFYTSNNIYFYEVSDQQIHLITFSLSNQTIIDEFSFDLLYDDFLFSIKNERMYLLGFNEHESQFDTYKPLQLLIADLKTGKTLYKGESMITSSKQQSKMNHGLSIHDLQVYEIN
ncbi:hypothetical protein MHI18_00310 [Peribacillus sp. FSL H8-0477]|uniref:hypothetical protein n=1 Tax=Peribacillus sp. FSL H8-0477 TaxID=2921388 RepID=UPI0030F512E8